MRPKRLIRRGSGQPGARSGAERKKASGEPAGLRLSHLVFYTGYYAERDGLSYSFVGEHEPAAARWQVLEYPSPPPPPAPPPPERKLLLSNDEVVRRLAAARRTGTFDMDGAFG